MCSHVVCTSRSCFKHSFSKSCVYMWCFKFDNVLETAATSTICEHFVEDHRRKGSTPAPLGASTRQQQQAPTHRHTRTLRRRVSRGRTHTRHTHHTHHFTRHKPQTDTNHHQTTDADRQTEQTTDGGSHVKRVVTRSDGKVENTEQLVVGLGFHSSDSCVLNEVRQLGAHVPPCSVNVPL